MQSTGLPVDDHSLSTTRITLPDALPPNAKPRDITHVKPEHPHWPLVVMTVLTQMSVGAFTTIWLLQLLGVSSRLGIAALASLLVGGAGAERVDAAPRTPRARLPRAAACGGDRG